MKKSIPVSLEDSIKFNKWSQKWIVNGIGYPANKYKLIIKDISPEDILSKEIKSLRNGDLLKKKLTTYFNNLERLRYLSGDDKLLKIKSINKSKKIIKGYLNQLKQDANFNIKKLENAISLNYLGKYVSFTKVVVF